MLKTLLNHLNFAILQKFCILTHSNFAFLSDTHFISLSLFDMSLNLIVEAIERFKQLVEQHYKEPVNEEFEDCIKEVLPGVETESCRDDEDRNIPQNTSK